MNIAKQTGKLIARIVENLPEMDSDTRQGWIDNPKALQKFLSGLAPQTILDQPGIPIVLKEFFRNRKGLVVSDQFYSLIFDPALEFTNTEPIKMGYRFNIPSPMEQEEVLKELGEGYIVDNPKAFLVWLAHMITLQSAGGEGELDHRSSNHFFVRGQHGKVFLVQVSFSFSSGDWWIELCPYSNDSFWVAGIRVFSASRRP